MITRLLRRIKGIIGNLTANVRGFQVAYIAETYNWSIKHDGESITRALTKQGLTKARVTYCPCLLKNHIVHFGSVNTFFTKRAWNRPHPSNQVILTWFHVVDDDPRVKRLVEIQNEVDLIHTSCKSTKNTLVEAGIQADKIVVIPLGVDTSVFTLVTNDEKNVIRDRLGIARNRLVIGSFQKDGVGWGEGLMPKLIKGPDILVETIARLKQYNPLVLLTGPSRGYVKKRLDELEIDYIHTYLQDTEELPAMYQALNLYLITSRVEGGPKSLLEAWASGIPVVSTRVGMVLDIAKDHETVMLCNIEDTKTLTQACEELIMDTVLRERLTQNALKQIDNFDWKQTSKQYVKQLYESSHHRASLRKSREPW